MHMDDLHNVNQHPLEYRTRVRACVRAPEHPNIRSSTNVVLSVAARMTMMCVRRRNANVESTHDDATRMMHANAKRATCIRQM